MVESFIDELLLRPWHLERGARFGSGDDGAGVLDYGDPDLEYLAIMEGAALFQDRPRTRLELLGEDRIRFLNGLVSCDLRGFAEGQGAYAFFTDLKGKVIADGVVLGLADRLRIELPSATRVEDRLEEHLRKYLVADRVEIRRSEVFVPLVLMGPEALVAVDQGLPTAGWTRGCATFAGVEVDVVRDQHRGVEAWTVWIPAAAASGVASELVERCGLRPVGGRAVEVVRVESRLPRFGIDFGADNLPQETGLESEAVSYDKGCYLGQEVVARLHYRGQAARRMCRLLGEGDQVPARGALFLEGREAGALTSVVDSPRYGRPVGLGIVQRRAESGSRVVTDDGLALLVEELGGGADVPRETSTLLE